MIVYIAGGWQGNLAPYWKDIAMKLYLAGVKGHPKVVEPIIRRNAMRIFLAGGEGEKPKNTLHEKYDNKLGNLSDIPILESYFYARDLEWVSRLIEVTHEDYFMLDSGAFTYMRDVNAGIGIDWDRYIEEYAEYVNKHNIKLFVEMDIDNVVGLSKVEKLRQKLEKLTGKKSIPVWHRNRGKQYYFDMCKEYDYIAIGGLVSAGAFITDNEKQYFPWFIQEAHRRKAKIHAMGFTRFKDLKRYNFDSVDSTAWTYGNRGGFLYYFDGKDMNKIRKPAGTRMKSRESAVHNFTEWVRYARYMETYKSGIL